MCKYFLLLLRYFPQVQLFQKMWFIFHMRLSYFKPYLRITFFFLFFLLLGGNRLSLSIKMSIKPPKNVQLSVPHTFMLDLCMSIHHKLHHKFSHKYAGMSLPLAPLVFNRGSQEEPLLPWFPLLCWVSVCFSGQLSQSELYKWPQWLEDGEESPQRHWLHWWWSGGMTDQSQYTDTLNYKSMFFS